MASLGSFLKDFGKVALALGPQVIHMTHPELDPIASSIVHGVAEAQGLAGASGPEKLQHVVNMGNDAAAAFNTASKGTKVDTTALDAVISNSVNAIVAATNALVKAPPAQVGA